MRSNLVELIAKMEDICDFENTIANDLILANILNKLDIKDVLNLMQSNKNVNKQVERNIFFWRSKCKAHLGIECRGNFDNYFELYSTLWKCKRVIFKRCFQHEGLDTIPDWIHIYIILMKGRLFTINEAIEFCNSQTTCKDGTSKLQIAEQAHFKLNKIAREDFIQIFKITQKMLKSSLVMKSFSTKTKEGRCNYSTEVAREILLSRYKEERILQRKLLTFINKSKNEIQLEHLDKQENVTEFIKYKRDGGTNTYMKASLMQSFENKERLNEEEIINKVLFSIIWFDIDFLMVGNYDPDSLFGQ